MPVRFLLYFRICRRYLYLIQKQKLPKCGRPSTMTRKRTECSCGTWMALWTCCRTSTRSIPIYGDNSAQNRAACATSTATRCLPSRGIRRTRGKSDISSPARATTLQKSTSTRGRGSFPASTQTPACSKPTCRKSTSASSILRWRPPVSFHARAWPLTRSTA